MKTLALTLTAVALSFTATAGAETMCLTLKEQKTLGQILTKYEETAALRPECREQRGAGACLDSYSEGMRRWLEHKLQECAKEE